LRFGWIAVKSLESVSCLRRAEPIPLLIIKSLNFVAFRHIPALLSLRPIVKARRKEKPRWDELEIHLLEVNRVTAALSRLGEEYEKHIAEIEADIIRTAPSAHRNASTTSPPQAMIQINLKRSSIRGFQSAETASTAT
jgi:hypothetical protein